MGSRLLLCVLLSANIGCSSENESPIGGSSGAGAGERELSAALVGAVELAALRVLPRALPVRRARLAMAELQGRAMVGQQVRPQVPQVPQVLLAPQVRLAPLAPLAPAR